MSSIKETVIFSHSACEIVTDPFIVGDDLLHLSYESCKDFLCSLDRSKLHGPFTVLNILRGGRYYRLTDAWNATINQSGNTPLQLAEIRASRDVDSNGEWYAKVWHDDSVASIPMDKTSQHLLSMNTLFIGDTVATGATLANVLKWVVQWREKHGVTKPFKIIIFSICGSSIAKYRLFPMYDSVLRPRGIGMEMVLANAGYVLNEQNGTDLSLVTSEMIPAARTHIEAKVGKAFMMKMKCAIWDWGDRFNGIDRHLEEVTEYFSTFHPWDLPEHIRQSVMKHKKPMSKL